MNTDENKTENIPFNSNDPHQQRPIYRKNLPLQALDASMDRGFASLLSTSVYTDSAWMIAGIGESWEKTPIWRMANTNEKDPNEIERSCILKEFCSQVKGVNLKQEGSAQDPITGKETPWSYSKGLFYFGDLACAALVERKRMDNSTVIELSFRGTEKTTTGDEKVDKRNLIGGFFLSAYKDLEGHYERHRLIIDEAVRLTNERINQGERVSLQVSGHSLGGSMAEFFMKKDASRIEGKDHVQGCTFGSPGMGDKQPAFSMLVKGFARLIATQLGLKTDNARIASSNFTNSATDDGMVRPKAKKTSLVQFVNTNDPIPKIGLLGGYRPSGAVYFSDIRSFDPVTKMSMNGSLLDIAKHSSLEYANSRMFALMRHLKRNAREGNPNENKINLALDRLNVCRIRSVTLKEKVEPLLNIGSPLEPELFKKRIQSVLNDAQLQRGMVPKTAPNFKADETKFNEVIRNGGAQILAKLSARRAHPSQIKTVEKVMSQASAAVSVKAAKP